MGLMGSYLRSPITTKESEDVQNKKFVCGVSSMQGWREEQEDAHNCILDFDEEASLFGVYDGHGGSEVAIYTSEKLPDFVKNAEEYKSGNFKEALISAFLTFDDSLRTEEANARLTEIIATKKQTRDAQSDDNDGDVYENGDMCDPETETPDSLRRDASRPLEEVIASYQVPARSGARSSGACSSSFSGECSTSFVQSSSSADECSSSSSSKRADKESGDAASNSEVNGESEEASSSAISKEQSEEKSETSKSSKNESLTNGPSSLVNGVASSVNGDVEAEAAEKCEKPVKNSPSQSEDKPSSSSPLKKKKITLSDLNDSEIVKNFITNEEISEDDEDDSEDETFRLEESIVNDSDDDDDDDDSEEEEEEEENAPILGEPNDEDEDEDDETFEVEDEEESEGSSDDDDDEDDDDDDNIAFTSSTDDGGDLVVRSERNAVVRSGCTAVVALIKGDTLYVANAGDSRCVICKNGVAVNMSEDHKPTDKDEYARIKKAGGSVSDGRVDGGLNLSRAFGDHEYKLNTELSNREQKIIALPDVRVCKLEPDVEFIVLACDGIWNSMSSQEVVDFVRPKIENNEKLSKICEEMFDKCLATDTWDDEKGCDNMTCIVVKPKRDKNLTCDTKEVDAKITTTTSVNAETNSVPASDNVVGSSHSEQDDKNNEAVPSAELSESSTVVVDEGKGDASLTSTSQKRCADSTGDDDDVQATKRQKTEQNDDSS